MRSWFATRSSTGSSSGTAAASAGAALHRCAAAPTGSSNFRDSGSIDDTAKDKDYRMGGAILIVEDELVTQRLIAASLERAGYQAIRAASVEQAEAAIREVLPDLMLLDWILPGTTGMSFLRHLRSERRTREIPVIMLTGRSDEIETVGGAGYCFRANPG